MDNECEDSGQDEEEADMAVVMATLAVRVKSASSRQPEGRWAERQLGQPARRVRFSLPGERAVQAEEQNEEQGE